MEPGDRALCAQGNQKTGFSQGTPRQVVGGAEGGKEMNYLDKYHPIYPYLLKKIIPKIYKTIKPIAAITQCII